MPPTSENLQETLENGLQRSQIQIELLKRELDLPQEGSSFNDEEASLVAVVATETMALRWDSSIGYYMELLVLDERTDVSRIKRNAGSLLWQHYEYIGKVENAWIEQRKLVAKLLFSRSFPLAIQVYADIKARLLSKFSIGYMPQTLEFSGNYDEKSGHPIYFARDIVIYEVTVTPMPQDVNTHVRDAQKQLYSVELIRREEPSMPPEATPTPTPTPSQIPSQQELIARIEREAAEKIEFFYRQKEKHGLSQDFVQSLITRGLSKEAGGIAILEEIEKRQVIETPPPEQSRIEVTSHEIDTQIDMGVEILLARNLPQAQVRVRDGNRFRHHSMTDIAKSMLEDKGIRTRGLPPFELFKRMQGMEAFKTLQSNYAARVLLEGYQSQVKSWDPFILRRPLSGFSDAIFARASRAPALQKVVNGIVKQGTLAADEIEKAALASYSRFLVLGRQAILSDDLGQFTGDVWQFGIMAGVLESRLIYAQLVNNPVMSDGKKFWSADHRNVGNGEKLDIDGLSAARKAIRSQRNSQNEVISLNMRCVIGGTDLETIMEQLLLLGNNPASTDQANPFKGKYIPISDPMLDDNPDVWIATTGKEMNPIGVLGYYDGQEGPYILSSDSDITVDGTTFRYGIDVVAKLVDWRGAWINKVPAKTIPDPAEDVEGFIESGGTTRNNRNRPGRNTDIKPADGE
jgi:hypothetical protein